MWISIYIEKNSKKGEKCQRKNLETLMDQRSKPEKVSTNSSRSTSIMLLQKFNISKTLLRVSECLKTEKIESTGDINAENLRTVCYKFGANELSIGGAVVDVLNMLEARYGNNHLLINSFRFRFYINFSKSSTGIGLEK